MEALLKNITDVLSENPNFEEHSGGGYIDRENSLRINREMLPLFNQENLYKFERCFSPRYDYKMIGNGGWYYKAEWIIKKEEPSEPIEFPKNQKFDVMDLEDV